MSYETTRALLEIDTPEALAKALQERIQGRRGTPPVRDDWTWTEAASRAANIAREEPTRKRLAEAVTRLLAEFFQDPADGRLVKEWPAGLLRLVQQVAWTEAERKTIARYLVGLLLDVDRWPIGKETAPTLSSPAVELHRSVRWFVKQIPFTEHEGKLITSIKRLLDLPGSEDRDGELGALIAIHASYESQRVLAMRPLREIYGDTRDRVLYAIDREYFNWHREVREIGEALFAQFERACDDSVSPGEDLSWAARAALRFGKPTPEFRERMLPESREDSRTIVIPLFMRPSAP